MSLPHFPSSDTLPQSPAFIKQPFLTGVSINILTFRPTGTGQALKRTFISANQNRRAGLHMPQNTSPPSKLHPCSGISSLFLEGQLLSRLSIGKVCSWSLPWRERREKKFNPQCAGEFPAVNAPTDGVCVCVCVCVCSRVCVCVCICLRSFTQEKDYVLYNIWQPYSFLFFFNFILFLNFT